MVELIFYINSDYFQYVDGDDVHTLLRIYNQQTGGERHISDISYDFWDRSNESMNRLIIPGQTVTLSKEINGESIILLSYNRPINIDKLI